MNIKTAFRSWGYFLVAAGATQIAVALLIMPQAWAIGAFTDKGARILSVGALGLLAGLFVLGLSMMNLHMPLSDHSDSER